MKSQTKLLLISFIFIGLYSCDCFAQSSRFKTGVVAGLNFSELEGDEITDYLGLNAGLIGTARLSKHTQLGMEILFSQNGEYILPESYPALQYGQIWLNHIEVPIHFDWLIGVFQRNKFYDWNLNIGIAYTRLLNYNIENNDKVNVNDLISYENKQAILLQAGTIYNFTKNIGLNLKASLPIRIEGLNWTLAARLVYVI
ncbi:MAG: outer membrane beta-barrel protein [Saprospiraceae bacterium]|nr:outer membrane beta-barrel protein [Candidatus Defluviibacterium haderslevense]